MGGRMWG